MESKDLKKDIFNEIESQINKMDNKAGLLISAVGIVFALTIDLFGIFSIKSFIELSFTFKFFSYLFLCVYCSSFMFSMFMFIWSIFPRKNKKQKSINKENFHVNYYYDLSDLSRKSAKESLNRNEVFNKAIVDEIKTSNNIDNQIFTNADICRKKHDKIYYGILALIPFAASMIGLIVLMIIGFQL